MTHRFKQLSMFCITLMSFLSQPSLANNPILLPPLTLEPELKFNKPKGINDEHWLSLKAAVLQEAEFLPDATGISGANSYFGQTVSVDGDRAVVGAPINTSSQNPRGAVYVYDFDGTDWNISETLLSPNTIDENHFGQSVSLIGNRILIGDFIDNGNTGAAYVYDFDGTNWTLSQKLTASVASTTRNFGYSVSLSGSRALIGAYLSNSNVGSAFVFDFDGTNWFETEELTASDAATSDFFGFSVSLSGDRALIGASRNDDSGTDSGSAYIFDFDGSNWAETSKLLANDAASRDYFGYSVSLLDNRAVIGAFGDDVTGLTSSSGSAYVYDFDGTSWGQTTKLTASDETSGDSFGTSVVLSSNRILIGSPKDNLSIGGSDAGSAYVFDFDGSNWSETAKIQATDAASRDELAISVSLFGDRLLVGAFKDDDNGADSGSAYVFDFDGINWIQSTKILAPISSAEDQFGFSVSIDNNMAIVGAPFDGDLGNGSGSVYFYNLNGNTWSLDSKQFAADTSGGHQFGRAVSILNNRAIIGAVSARNNSSASSGAAYVFEYDGSNWIETAKLLALDGASSDLFGLSIELQENRVIIGAEGDDINSSNRDSGAAYVFDYDGTNWSQTTKLTASDRRERDNFGHSVSLSGDTALIGAYRDDFGSLTNFGSVYVFEFNGTNWAQSSKLIANDAASSDSFGTSVSLVGNRALIGSPGDDDNGGSSGSVYIFDFDGSNWIQSHKLQASEAPNNYRFGTSVSLSNDQLLIGNNPFNDRGSAYLFDFDGTIWTQSNKLIPSDGALNNFGVAVSLSGDKAIGGATTNNEYGANSGAAYIFDVTAFSVAGSITGLATGNQVVLQNNTSDDLIVNDNGSFKFNTGFINGATYSVSVLTQPSTPNQNCTISNGSGTIAGSDISNVSINCITISYSISVNVSGLANNNQLVLQNNSGDDLTADSNSQFTFSTTLLDESTYDVTVLSQPTSPNQNCAISNGSSSLIGMNADNINVVCTTIQYTIAGNVSGLASGNSLVLQNNSTNDLNISADGSFVFSMALDDESAYNISVLTQPTDPNQSCTVANQNGILAGANISDVTVVCTTTTYTIGGVLAGLASGATVTLQNNTGDDLILTDNGVFTFATGLDDTSNYSIIVSSQPNNPNQTCLIAGGNSGNNNGTGVLAGANDSSIIIICNSQPVIVNDIYTINEDSLLTANDANGSNANQDGVLVNDSDSESDPLTVVNPGTFTLGGIGGLITINADGTFVLIPSTDASGQASFSFQVTDGFHAVSSSLTVTVNPVNDSPSFDIIGDIDTIPLVTPASNQIQINNFANNISFGPPDENMQGILRFNIIVFSDFDNILNNITIANNGMLDIDLTRNDGVASLGISLQDNGGTTNSGDDTSSVVPFSISYIDSVFSNDFENIPVLKFLNEINKTQPDTTKFNYDEFGLILFYGESIIYNPYDHTIESLLFIQGWMQETLKSKDPMGDFDQDGTVNIEDRNPFNHQIIQ